MAINLLFLGRTISNTKQFGAVRLDLQNDSVCLSYQEWQHNIKRWHLAQNHNFLQSKLINAKHPHILSGAHT